MQQQNFSQINNRINSITCFLCGRQFGTKGFSFHHKECKIKFTNEQNLRPTKDRKKAPQPPEGISHILEGNLSKVDLKKQIWKNDRFNIKSNEIHKYQVLPSCKYCGRTFNYESLAPHMKGCDKQKTYKEEKQNNIEINFKIPKSLVCNHQNIQGCVCGQRFGTQSLRIHYPQCTKKFIDDQYRKHKKQIDRRKPPQFSQQDENLMKTKIQWTDQQMESFNNNSMKNYRQHGMVQCSNCKRKFFDEQLAKHQKNCILINGVLNTVQKIEKKQIQPKKPKIVMCVICGRQYGLASIRIHHQNCVQLYKKQQSIKLKSQRKPLPRIPQDEQENYKLSQAEQWSIDKIESYNKMVSNIYNTKSLSKCYICLRTFFEQSLPKHLKQCETRIKDVKKLQKFKIQLKNKKNILGQNFLENVIEINKQINKLKQKSTIKPKVLMCYLCGRQYGLLSLKIHIPQCKIKPINSKKLQNDNFKQICNSIEQNYTIQDAENWTPDLIEKYNKQVYQVYKKQSLFQCKYCHRTFFEESLKKHIKHCQNNYKKQKQGKSKVRRAQTMMTLSSPEKNISVIQTEDNLSQSPQVIRDETQSIQQREETVKQSEFQTEAMSMNLMRQDQLFTQSENSQSNFQIEIYFPNNIII